MNNQSGVRVGRVVLLAALVGLLWNNPATWACALEAASHAHADAAALPTFETNHGHDRFLSRIYPLTIEGRRAGEGYFSPDGKKMIVQTERYPGNPFFQIYILDLETGDSTLVSPGVGRTTCSYFRAGTNDVLFASTHLDPNARTHQQEMLDERAATAGQPRRTHWVYDEYFDIYACDQRGMNLRRLTDTPGYDAEGAYSPDGKLIVFSSIRHAYPTEKLTDLERELLKAKPENFGELYLMNADGSNVRRLTDWKGNDGGPFFTADGERIIWRHFDESGLFADIYTMKIDGTDLRRLTDFMCMSWSPYMHPSGEYAIFASNKMGFANFELYIVDAMGEKEPVRVTYTDKFDGLAVFSPDGKHLAWTSSRSTQEPYTGQILFADWDHEGALAALEAAPPRGTPAEPWHPTGSIASGWPQGPPPPAAKERTPKIAADELYAHVKYLASDELTGRMTGTEGAKQAGDYIAKCFKQAGLEPLGDNGTYFQKFTFPAGIDVVTDDCALNIMHAEGMSAPESLLTGEVDEDFRPLSFSSNDTAHAEVICAGYGLVVPGENEESSYDSYKGLDVHDKIVLVFDDVPANLSTEQRVKYGLYASARYKAKQAAQRGAAGFLLVVGPNTAGTGSLMGISRTSSELGIVAASITDEVAEKLVSTSGTSLKQLQDMLEDGELPPHGMPELKGIGAKLTCKLERQEGSCRNVVAMLPPQGNGPMSNEFIVVGAHYDHIGHGEAGGSRAHAGEEGMIHNGADDNASGTAAVLELAHAFAAARRQAPAGMPQRGVIFACWSGEEIGVIGSTHFVRHAPCPLDRIAAYFNFDMVGRLRDGKLVIQGVGSSSDWRRFIEKANIQVPLAVSLQDDPYLPTDTHEFYPNNIPVLSLFTDMHDDYNRPTDDADTLNYPGLERITKFANALVRDLTTGYERPRHVEVKRTLPRAGGRRGRIYTGTIPDFASSAKGMAISGVQGGSPAEKAGLQGGDVIIKFAGQEITGLEDYSVVLRAVKADEPVEIVVKRDGQDVTLTITPSTRK
jgi:Tol biopolymer transport system component